MESYTFYEGLLPPGFSLEYEPALFNTDSFLLTQCTTGWLHFHVLDPVRNKAVAAIHIHVDHRIARSPLKAPFGSVEFSPRVSPGVLFDFLQFVEGRMASMDVSEVQIKNPPRAYSPREMAMLETWLVNQGYVVSNAEAGAVIQVSDEPFSDRVRHSEKLRLRQAHEAGLQFRKLHPADLDALYHFIEKCHADRGYVLSISFEQLRKTVQRFPGQYMLSAVMEEEEMIAGSVSIRVKSNILYNFLMNHIRSHNHLSPPTLLLEASYNHCREQGISLFDLGTSALQGKPNFSLLDFKLRMGAEPTSKYSFVKKLR